MQDRLAIVIPAYKDTFLDQTLQSLDRQTCTNFNVYIGDDNSPYDLEPIVRKFSDRLHITYKRFNNNLGSTNLIGQWERCLQMITDETYFCLFSDDDLMGERCVEQFYQTLNAPSCFDVYHFDIDLIDENGKQLKSCNPYPPVITTEEFLRLLYTYQIDARMPEFIFSTQHFRESGGFINFDLAYRSDNATVLVNARDKGICTIPGAKVLWRDSGINISSNHNDALKSRKVYASIDFFNWLDGYYAHQPVRCPFDLQEWLLLIITDILTLDNGDSQKNMYRALKRIKRVKKNIILYLRCKVYIRCILKKQKKRPNKIWRYLEQNSLTPYSKRQL